MADEISLQTSLNVTKDSLRLSRSVRATIDMAGEHFASGAQTIGTTHETVTIPADVATLGVALFVNLDDTNYVELGVDVSATFHPLVRLNPGEPGAFRLAQGITLYARANTAAVVLEFHVMED